MKEGDIVGEDIFSLLSFIVGIIESVIVVW